MISLKQVLVNAPPKLREKLDPLSTTTLMRRCAGWTSTEIKVHEEVLTRLTTDLTRQLVDAFGVGPTPRPRAHRRR